MGPTQIKSMVASALCLCTLVALAAEPLIYAPLPLENLSRTQAANQPLVDLLAELLERPVEMRLYESHSDLLAALGTGEADLAHLGPLPLLLAKSETPSLVELAVFREADGAAEYRCVIAAPVDGFQSISDAEFAEGTPTLALTREESTCGPTAAFAILSGAGLDPRQFLATYEGGHDAVAKAVLLQKHQIGGLKESVAQVWSDLGIRVLAASEPVPGIALVASPGSLSSEEMEALGNSLMGLGKDRLAGLQNGRHGFAPFDPLLLERVRELRADSESLIDEMMQ